MKIPHRTVTIPSCHATHALVQFKPTTHTLRTIINNTCQDLILGLLMCETPYDNNPPTICCKPFIAYLARDEHTWLDIPHTNG